MKPTRAFYSVVQYVPDIGRAEAANAGVVLLIPSEKRIEVRTSPTLARVRQFFAPGKRQLQRIGLALEALKHRMELAHGEFHNEEEFAQFVASRADTVRLTPPRLVVINEPMSDLTELYNELVGDREPANLPSSKFSFPQPVAQAFGRLETERKVWRPGSIIVPTIRREFDVAAAYQNGVVNYVRPESLAKRVRLEPLLAKLGFNGQLIHQHEIDGKRGKLIVLSSNPEVKQKTEQEFAQALEEFHVRFVTYKQAEEFATEVERTAHVADGLAV
jgi:hypothetical protein